LVYHSCDVRHCVNPNHLFLGTSIENNRDRDIKNRGRYVTGDDHPGIKLTDEEVRQILDNIKSGKYLSIYEVINEYSVGLCTIWDILYGRTRTNVSKDYDLITLTKKIKTYITDDEARLIKIDLQQGYKVYQLMRKYNRSRDQISRIKNNKSFTHV
jgi:hypothetical protein